MKAKIFWVYNILGQILIWDLLLWAPEFLSGQIIDRNVNDFIPPTYSGSTCPFDCSCKREVVNCASLGLTYLPDYLDLGPYTTSLDARNNQISQAGPRTFQRLVNLTNMQLNDNLLARIESYSFMNMKELKYLYLQRNKISTIRPHAFYGLTKLTLLYLNHNQIKVLDYRSFVSLGALKELSFQSNLIERLPQEILLQTPSLYLIKMGDNPISCDCGIKWLLDKLKSDMERGSPFIADVICRSPQRLKDISIMTLRDDKHLTLAPCLPNLTSNRVRPQFMEQPEDRIVKIGDFVELNCGAKGNPIPHIKWMKNDNIMTQLSQRGLDHKNGSALNSRRLHTGDDRVVIKRKITRGPYVSNQLEVMSIWPVLPEDEGFYYCLAYNSMGKLRSKRAKVDVILPGIPHDSLHYDATTTTAEARNPQFSFPNKEIRCGDLFANPKFTRVRWSKGDKFLGEPEDEKYAVVHGKGGLLVIKNFTQQLDEGIYTCHVKDYFRDAKYPDDYRYQAFVTTGTGEGLRNYIGKDAVSQPLTPHQARPPNPNFAMYHKSPNPLDGEGKNRETAAATESMYFSKMSPAQNRSVHEVKNITSTLEVNLGQSFVMDCDAAKGETPLGDPIIVWTKDDIDIPAVNEGFYQSPGGTENYLTYKNGSLKIVEFGVEDAGSYRCEIFLRENGAEASSKSRPLTVVAKRGVAFARPGQALERNENVERLDESNRILLTEPGTRDRLTLVKESVSQATRQVDAAIRTSITNLKKHGIQGNFKEMMAYLRYPSGDAFQLARAGDIFHRTFQIIEDYIEKEGQALKDPGYSSKRLQREILSATHINLIANMSGCRPSADQRLAANGSASASNPCGANICSHTKYRSPDGSCNNLFNPSFGSALMPFHRLLPARYENGLNTPLGWNNVPHNSNVSEILYSHHDSQKSHSNMTVGALPNPRLVSRLLATTDTIAINREYTMMLMQWGQFLDHDLDFAVPALSYNSFVDVAPCGEHCFNSQPCYPIKPMEQDPRIDRQKCIEFVRSSAVCGTGSSSYLLDSLAPREQINSITAFVDASNVYGSSEEVAQDLKEFVNGEPTGRLRVGLPSPYVAESSAKRGGINENNGHKTFLPFNTGRGMDCKRGRGFSANTRVPCLLAGDHRANEQLGLLAMHTLWMREHNRIVDRLSYLNPHWRGERLYQEARKIVGAEMQVITYHEWLPKIIGQAGIQRLQSSAQFHQRGQHYPGYDSKIDPGIANVFATAVLRFGHSLVNPTLFRLNASFEPLAQYGGHLPLHKAFFAPARLLEEGGIDPLLRGLFGSPSKKVDTRKLITNELTEKLFEHHHNPAFDLIAINLQRGRDHGLPSYGQWREWCGQPLGLFDSDLFFRHLGKESIAAQRLKRIRAFHEALGGLHMFGNLEAVAKLADLYFHPNDIEMWIGGMLENPLPGALLGPTFTCLIVDQFRRLRDGDRFWYQNYGVFNQPQLAQIEKVSLSAVLCNNGDGIDKIQPDAFLYVNSTYPYLDCSQISGFDLTPWVQCPGSQGKHFLTNFGDSFSCQALPSSQACPSSYGQKFEPDDPKDRVKPSEPETSMYYTSMNQLKQSSQAASGTLNRPYDEDLPNEITDMRSELVKLQKELESMNSIIMGMGKQMKATIGVEEQSCLDSSGHYKSDGEKWDEGPCTSCKCHFGKMTCYTINCPDIRDCPASSRYKSPDQCCASCIN